MKVKSIIFALFGLLVGVGYAIESLLYFKGNGISGPLFFRILICALGFYVFARNVKNIRGAT